MSILETVLRILKKPPPPGLPSLQEVVTRPPNDPAPALEENDRMLDKLTANFGLSEFRCRDGSGVPEELLENVQLLADNLQVLREHLGKPIRVISGYRSPKYNRKIGGARKSQHMLAKAADIKISGMAPGEIKRVIEDLITLGKMHPGGVGLYKTFTHYDVRGRNARWYGKGMKDDTP
jgi:uncharacterized protein YcbK (DUF882 family)